MGWLWQYECLKSTIGWNYTGTRESSTDKEIDTTPLGMGRIVPSRRAFHFYSAWIHMCDEVPFELSASFSSLSYCWLLLQQQVLRRSRIHGRESDVYAATCLLSFVCLFKHKCPLSMQVRKLPSILCTSCLSIIRESANVICVRVPEYAPPFSNRFR
jgi:hypothetical protein